MNKDVVKSDNKQDVKVNKNEYILPLADIIETESEFIIEMEMPGIEKDKMDINIENDVLTIESNADFEDKCKLKCVAQDFVLQNYKRSFNLNNSVDINHISAEMENGILRLTLAKSENLKPRKIEVKAG
jgi:HSP20 family protein